MSQRIARVNSLIQRLFGEILQREADIPADALVTVSAVEAARNLRSAKVWLYILPFPMNDPKRAEEVLEHLRGQLYQLQGFLNKALAMRPLPRIALHLDHGSAYANSIEKKLGELQGDIPEDSEGVK